MRSKNIQSKFSQNEVLQLLKRVDLCDVSKASAEIMLDRFSNGKEIEFPFDL